MPLGNLLGAELLTQWQFGFLIVNTMAPIFFNFFYI